MKRRSFLKSIAAVVFGGTVALKAKAGWHFIIAEYNGNDKPLEVYLNGKKLEETSDYGIGATPTFAGLTITEKPTAIPKDDGYFWIQTVGGEPLVRLMLK